MEGALQQRLAGLQPGVWKSAGVRYHRPLRGSRQYAISWGCGTWPVCLPDTIAGMIDIAANIDVRGPLEGAVGQGGQEKAWKQITSTVFRCSYGYIRPSML